MNSTRLMPRGAFPGEFILFRFNRRAFIVLTVSAVLLAISPLSEAQSTIASSVSGPSVLATNGVSVTQTGAKGGPDSSPSLVRANATFVETSQYDDSTGWSFVLTPDLSLRLNRHVFFDGNLPWYQSLQATVPVTVNGVTAFQLETKSNVLGDATSSAHFEAGHDDFGYNAVVTVGYPTGDKSLGVSAGTTTYHFNNHLEHSFGPFTPDVEVGIGNSSALASHLVRKAYTAVGAIANFQAGANIDLPRKSSLDLEFYEAMPLAAQDVFGTIGHQGKGPGKKVLLGATGGAEDNGVTAELAIPLTSKVTLAGNYNRSFIQANAIAGFSLTWQLRTPKKTVADAPASPVTRFGN